MKSKSPWSRFLDKSLKSGKKATRHVNKFLVQRMDSLSQVKRPIIGWLSLVVLIATVSTVQWILLGRSLVNEVGGVGGSY